MKIHNYDVEIFYSDEDEAYVADVPKLKYCSIIADSFVEAKEQIGPIIKDWLEVRK